MGTPPDSSKTTPVPSAAPKSRRWLYIVVVVLIAGIVVGSVLWYEYAPGGPQRPYIVHVTEILWTRDSAPLASSSGFSHHAGTTAHLFVNESCPAPAPGYGPATCLSGSVYTLTSGFFLVSTNAPFQWSSGTGGANATVFVNVSLPLRSFTGVLTIDFH